VSATNKLTENVSTTYSGDATATVSMLVVVLSTAFNVAAQVPAKFLVATDDTSILFFSADTGTYDFAFRIVVGFAAAIDSKVVETTFRADVDHATSFHPSVNKEVINAF
jgi:hypothetical protein